MNCIIVEDEYPSREELKYFINKYSQIIISKEFDNAIDALKFLESNTIDIIFLDINMPGLDGMSFAKIIKKFEDTIKIVFTTAYPEHAIDAFEIEAFDYILKPFSEERIISTLKKLEKSCDESKKCCNKIALKRDEKILLIDIKDIFFCEAMERDTLVYTKKNEYIINMGISDFLEYLNDNNFIRTHRSYIININKVKEIIPWSNNTYNIKFEGIEQEAPVSRSYIKEFKNKLNIK
ncbi:LytTR family DNA-binding domain-containing protein [Oceanotoga sp. DSM 15011]|jgi:two-component system LytT family response regulator|uniref:LytTR family two component transcriptional regulator n=1 Tax=Oceanotoga teriensis TaxID=515440 RepID=A0AA45C6R9_9BACT|nr:MULTISPECIES: LytTR family DNA-binding domain-containing protein [Oceanotoga]MDN5342830.1 two-component system, LytTR family, response regulator [Oceanotoga sp.]MDO7977797.1 LytTR family DNA-binding domain-containing protein [Oceanotoga teriensis]PWJ93200.1 LytTR family two component transcriptional regulator [Oceanotoga teriensis]UYP01194.1 LytTR family DNA-binding domain-containing protein [Oceanotoga sp. DSM 15011]